MKSRLLILLVSVVFLFSGCTFETSQESTETQNPTIIIPTPANTITATPNLPSGTITLYVWLPNEFDPNNGSSAANLLKERLDDFSTRRPGVQVETRIKNLEGPGSLLETLSATKEAAPLALPDLIALPYNQMQIAASQNLIYPLDSYISDVGSEDWYDFALELGQYQGEQYGISFAAHMLVMAYHPTTVGDPPVSWEELLSSEATLAFPATEADAIFTLALYQSLDGEILNENGILQVDRILLESVFDLYHQAIVTDMMPDWLNEASSDDYTWGNFIKNQSQLVITWTTHFFDPSSVGVNFTAIPTPDGTPFTYSDGWVWGLSGYDSSRYQTAVDLAEYLTEGEFLGEWTLAAGYLPTRPSSLAVWPLDPESAFISQILPTAISMPDIDNYPAFNEALVQATIEILNQQITPGEAADKVLASIEN